MTLVFFFLLFSASKIIHILDDVFAKMMSFSDAVK